MYHFRNFVFEGGGVKGIAYVGALEALEKRGICQNIVRVGGASAGAINAVLFAFGYSVKETKEILWSLDFKNFLDDSWGEIRDVYRLINEYGWYKGDYFRKWIGDIIKAKTGNPNSTFKEVHNLKEKKNFKDIFVIGTNLSTHFSEVFSHEHTPDVCVADAVRISMSIPLFFKAVRNFRNDVYVDGGVLRNYPIKLFDKVKYVNTKYKETDYYKKLNKKMKKEEDERFVYNKETLGFRLDTREEISMFRDQNAPKHYEINDLFDYLWALIVTIRDAQSNTHLHSDDWQRTIYIDTLGVKTTDFGLDDSVKRRLVESGRTGVEEYFEWFDRVKRAANK